jgi:hypothetical protein
MSLIVARQDGNQILIVSDTKLTYPDHEIKDQKTNPSEGIIKTIILSDNQCISFAGEVVYAEQALKEIGYENESDQIIRILTYYHKLSNYNTEFLYCMGYPPLLFQIKENQYSSVTNSYLGDKTAFEVFQRFMHDAIPQESSPNTSVPNLETSTSQVNEGARLFFENFNLSITTSTATKNITKMSSAMDYVIEKGNVDSVGGFRAEVLFDKKFSFSFYNKIYRSHFTKQGFGLHALGHGDAQEGAYSIIFYNGASDHKSVAIHIKQAEIGILYHRYEAGLLRPQLFKYDEVDFCDFVLGKYKIPVEIYTQDRAKKFWDHGMSEFKKGNYRDALIHLMKGLPEVQGKDKASFLFYIGTCNFYIGDHNYAQLYFNEAVRCDKNIQEHIRNFYSQYSQKRK